MNRSDVFAFEIRNADDAGKRQRVTGLGHAGEELENAHRIQSFGFHSVPPQGSHAIGLAPRGMRDLAIILGGEHPSHRPGGLGAGTTAIYDASGGIVSIVNKNIRMVGATLTAEISGVSMKISSAGVAFTGGRITHNDHDIGATHTHSQVSTGSAVSGPPV